MSVQRRVALVTFALSVTACSLLADFSGLTGAGVASDASTPKRDAAADATTDAQTSGDADASAPPFCTTQTSAFFCDDFDEGLDASLAARWDSIDLTTGTLTIDQATFFSPPASLFADVPANGSGDALRLAKLIPPHASTRVDLDMLMSGATDKTSYVSLVEIHLVPMPSGYADYRAAIIYQGGSFTLDVYAQPDDDAGTMGADSNEAIAVDFSSWRRIGLEVSLTPSPHASAYDDGTGTLIATQPLPAIAGAMGQTVVVGLPYVLTNATEVRLHTDNVTITVSD